MTALTWRVLALAVLGVAYAFIFGPAAVIVIDSLNSATSFPAPFESITLQWYAAMLHHSEFIDAFKLSVAVAAFAALIASVLGMLAAYALTRYAVPGKNAIATFLLGPLLVPQIVIGVAILQIVSLVGIDVGFGGLLGAHTVYVFPFALRLSMTSLAGFDFALEEAAQSLGAGRWQTFRHVTLPIIRQGVTSGFVFAFILSFVNLPTSLFLTSPQTATLPVVMYSYMEASLDPTIAAVASFILFLAIATTIVLDRVFRQRLLV